MLAQTKFHVDTDIVDRCIENCLNLQEKLVLNRPTGDFFYDNWIIKNEYNDSYWEEILKFLPYDIGEARVIRLLPGESYMAHADIDNRWHLNLTGEYSYLIDLTQCCMHELKKDYKWYYMDASKMHVATNFGSIDRFQLVVRQLLKKSNKDDLLSIVIESNGCQHDYRYKFDKIISPFLNRADKDFMLSDFKVEKELVSFKLSSLMITDFQKILTNDFKVRYV